MDTRAVLINSNDTHIINVATLMGLVLDVHVWIKRLLDMKRSSDGECCFFAQTSV